MNVQENLLFAVPPGPKAARLARVTQALADAELASFAQADPATLSGGQRARVALMRALLAQPHALLMSLLPSWTPNCARVCVNLYLPL